ncbi:unnamed protein product [Danaus chrysippus]|nr:unnamed protein product [Danaus chrysippus]CAG9574359.1 unnamed protein product [Danaus chrysippus]CAG9574797.1 unnamed protein product [Danaus chrysippus]CAG9575556.1 unnamed protein product [Danaus chrysippus]CAG9577017.1 unnamed protein product [Danaus chrysippus]
MPRKRTRTTTKASWTVDSLENAVSVLKRGGISVYKVSQQTGIPYSTLKKRYNLAKAGGSSYKHSPKLGRSTVFNVAQEEILANHLRTMSNKFYGLTREQFRKVCYSVAKQLGIEKRFNQDNQTAGKDWLAGFLQRHPDLSIFPMNPGVFCDDDFINEESRSAVPEADAQQQPTSVTPIPSTSNQAEQPHASPATSPSIFCDLQIETEIIQREAAVTPVSIPSTSSHTIRPIATPPNIDFANVVSIVSPLPQQLISQKQKPLKNKQHSEIITSTPMKAVFEEKKRKRTEKENKIKTIKKNKGNCDKENCVKGKCAKGKCIKKKHTKDKEIKSKKTTTRNTRIRKATKYLFKSDDENSSLDQIDENAICDDESEYSEEENLCAICLDLGKNGEMWYRCRSCGNWAHKECTGSDSPDTYICAFCLDP